MHKGGAWEIALYEIRMVLYFTVLIFVIGRISENTCAVEVRSIFNFIPNNYPFISIDETGRVLTLPLPARESP